MKLNFGRNVPLVLILVFMLLLSTGCAGQQAAAQPQSPEQVAEAVINILDRILPELTLPRIELEYDTDGVPAIFGIKTTTLQALLPMDLSFLNLDPAIVAWFQNSNLQHVEVELTEDGILLFANANPLPYIAWDEASLSTIAAMVASSGVSPQMAPVIEKALPLARRLGLDVVVRFPVSGTAIAVRDRSMRALAEAPEMEPGAAIRLSISYTKDGLPSILGLTSRDLRALGIDLSPLELPQATVEMLNAMNMQSLEVVTEADGITILLNGHPLPKLAYSQEHLANALDLVAQLYGDQPFLSVVRNLLPVLQATNLDVTVNLPASAMAE